MAILEPIFNEQVWRPVWLAEGQASDTDTQSDVGGMDALVLKPPADPFKLLMKKIEKLLEINDPDSLYHAFNLIDAALTDGKYANDDQRFILSQKWAELSERISDLHPEMKEQAFTAAKPSFVKPFAI